MIDDRFRQISRCLALVLLGLRRVMFVSLCGLLLSGCATTSPPVQEMSDARQALHAAREAAGGFYYLNALNEAEQLIEQASHELSQGNYRNARMSALAAKQRAIIAREAALAVKGGGD